MVYEVVIKRKMERGLRKLPNRVQRKFFALIEDLRDGGPVQSRWPNYSKLAEGRYHCHLEYHYVACWRCEGDQVIIEVYYVGSREDAPY